MESKEMHLAKLKDGNALFFSYGKWQTKSWLIAFLIRATLWLYTISFTHLISHISTKFKFSVKNFNYGYYYLLNLD